MQARTRSAVKVFQGARHSAKRCRPWIDASAGEFYSILEKFGGGISCLGNFDLTEGSDNARRLEWIPVSPIKLPAIPVKRGTTVEFYESLCTVYCALSDQNTKLSYRLVLPADESVAPVSHGVHWLVGHPEPSGRDVDSMNEVYAMVVQWYRPRFRLARQYSQVCGNVAVCVEQKSDTGPISAREVYAARRALANFFAKNNIQSTHGSPDWLMPA